MANFYNDNNSLKHHLSHPMMEKIVELKERNFADADKFDYAPQNFDDAMDSYDRVLEIVGDIYANVIAENAEDVDHEGPVVKNGHVDYASGTQKNLDACRKAGAHGHVYASSSRRPQLPYHSLHHGRRHGEPRRCRV